MQHSERAKTAARLHSVAMHLLRRVRREDAFTGLSSARLSVLSMLVFGGPRTVGELATAEQVRAPSMTRLLAALEAEGYVEREPSPTDRRSVVIKPARKAASALEEGEFRRVRYMLDLLGDLSDEEWAEVGAAVDLLASALEKAAPTERDCEATEGEGVGSTDSAPAPARPRLLG